MRSFLLVLLIWAGACLNCFAQKVPNTTFNLGIEGNLPGGKASNTIAYGLGFSFKCEYKADSNFYLSISSGYTALQAKESYQQEVLAATGKSKSTYGYIPIKIGCKFYIHEGLFGEAQVGEVAVLDGSGTAFAYSPGIGYVFDGGLELGFRYEGWSTSNVLNQYSMRLAYRFKW